MTHKNDQVWFITGANKGMGAEIAKEALNRGYKVIATARNPESASRNSGELSEPAGRPFDITDDGQVRSAVALQLWTASAASTRW